MNMPTRAVVLATVLAIAAPVLAVCAGVNAPPARHACCPEAVTGEPSAPVIPGMADACCRQADDAAGRTLAPALPLTSAPPPDAVAARLVVAVLDARRRVETGPGGTAPDHAVPKYLRFSVFLV